MSFSSEIPCIHPTFGAVPPEESTFAESRVVILQVPYDLTTSYNAGTREGPRAIIHASQNMELFDEELGTNTIELGIHTLPELDVEASGPEAMLERIGKAAEELLAKEKFVVMLGGEHSISLPVIRAHRRRYPDLSVLHFDAHADLRESFQGTPYSHACAMRKVAEEMPIVQLGIRSMSEDEHEFIRERKIPSWSARQVLRRTPRLPEMLSRLSRHVYVSIDLDALDPSIMPGVGTPVPGGLGWYDVMEALEALGDRKIVGFDVVELAPVPGSVQADFLAAKLTYRLIGLAHRDVLRPVDGFPTGGDGTAAARADRAPRADRS
jgi:agmatinase